MRFSGDSFEASDRDTERKTRYDLEPDPSYDIGFGAAYGWGWRPYWSYYRPIGGGRVRGPRFDARFWGSQYDLREVSRHVATVDIAIGKGPKPEGRRVLVVREVIASLGPGVVRPKN